MPDTWLDHVHGFLRNAIYLIHNRDPVFADAWTNLLRSGGVKGVRIPASSPKLQSSRDHDS